MSHVDWLSHLLKITAVTGRLDARRAYGAPWRVALAQSAAHEIAWHVVLEGRGVIEDSATETASELARGDIVLLPHGSAHVLHDGSGQAPAFTHDRQASAGWVLSENDGQGESLAMLSGRFLIAPPHGRLLREYLPATLVLRIADGLGNDDNAGTTFNRLAGLVALIRMESDSDKAGSDTLVNTLSSALFTLVLRAASESSHAPAGLPALAGDPRLAPAVSAMFADPARPWDLPGLAALCGMSRATFIRHFQDKLGRSAAELLTDIRMSLAANDLEKPTMTTEAVASSNGYRSVAAFRRVFADRMGMTPAQWRSKSRQLSHIG